MANRYLAGASGLPFAVLRGYVGTDLPTQTDTIRPITCPFTGEVLTAVPALTPDVTIIHAQRADTKGNVQMWGIIGVQKEAVLAAKRSLITVEEIVDRLEPQPQEVILPSFATSYIAVVPGGAHPSYAQGYSLRDNAFYTEWDAISRDRETFRRLDGCQRAAGRAGSMTGPYTADEMMTVAAARQLHDGAVCFVGIGLPSTAANLARATHAPGVVLIYESGTLGAKPDRLPLSIGDGILADTADTVVSVPEVFNYWLQPGRIDVGFLSAAQIDRFANINTTVIGTDYRHPAVRLPGAGGAPEIAASCREVVVVLRQTVRTFVDRVDFVTSVGFGQGAGDRQRLGLTGSGPRVVITDLGVLTPDPETCELTLVSVHPDATLEQARAATGWQLAVSPELAVTNPPSDLELSVLRRLEATIGTM